MTESPYIKVLKNKKVDKELNLKITQDSLLEKIFVEYSSKDGRLVVQKGFQDNHEGKKAAEVFQKRFKSIRDLKKYLGLSREIK